jgi:hypothetical protein
MHPVLALLFMIVGIGAVTAAIIFAVSKPQSTNATTAGAAVTADAQQGEQTKDSDASASKQDAGATEQGADQAKKESDSAKQEATGNKTEDATKADADSTKSQGDAPASAATGNARTGNEAASGDQGAASVSSGSAETNGGTTSDGAQTTDGSQANAESAGGTGGTSSQATNVTQDGWIVAESCATNVAESGTLTASDIRWNDGAPQVGLDLASYPHQHLGAYLEVQYGGVTVRAQIVDCGHYSDVDPSGIALNPAVYEQFGAWSVDDWGRREVSYRFV